MHYIVLDLEWNIPRDRQKADPELLKIFPEEIIEIGAIRLDESFRRSGHFSLDVKPRYYTTLNHWVEDLTKRENGSLQNGHGFERAATEFLHWAGDGADDGALDEAEDNAGGEASGAAGGAADNDYLLCTWSNSDSGPWLRNLSHYGLTHVGSPRFLDVQRLYGLAQGELSTQRSISFAAEHLGLSLDEPLHRAVNDASYTASIFAHTVHQLQSAGKLPSEPKALYQALRKYSYDPTLTYRAKADLGTLSSPSEADALLSSYPWHCPACHAPLQGPRYWKKRRGGLSRQAKAACPTHGEVILKVQLFRSPGATEGSPWIVKADLHLQRPL